MYGLKAFFLHFIIATTMFRQVQALQEAPISADLPPTPDSLEGSSMLLEMKRGSPETQAWLSNFHVEAFENFQHEFENFRLWE